MGWRTLARLRHSRVKIVRVFDHVSVDLDSGNERMSWLVMGTL